MLVLVLVLGSLLRLFLLDKQSLWLDEMTSLEIARKSVADIIGGAGFDRHTPPFYYLLLHGWLILAGDSVFSLRLLSAIFDVINIALVTVIMTRQFSPRAGLASGCLYALSPFAVYYAQEGRMYTLLISLTLAVYLLALRYAEGKRSGASALALLLLSTAGLYTHYYFALILAGVTAGLIIIHRGAPRQLAGWFVPLVITGLFFLPWVKVVLSLAASGGQAFRHFLFLEIPYTFFRFIAGYALMPLNYGAKAAIGETIRSELLLLVLFSVVFSFQLWLGARKIVLSRSVSFKSLFWCALLLPPFLALLLSLKAPMLSERYLTVIFPFFVALAALPFIDAPAVNRTVSGLVIALTLYALGSYYFSPGFGKIQWKEAARFIADSEIRAAPVFVKPAFADGVLRYYLGSGHPVRGLKNVSLPLETGGGFWLVEEGTEESSKAAFSGGPLRLSEERIFPLENGLRVYHFEPAKTD